MRIEYRNSTRNAEEMIIIIIHSLEWGLNPQLSRYGHTLVRHDSVNYIERKLPIHSNNHCHSFLYFKYSCDAASPQMSSPHSAIYLVFSLMFLKIIKKLKLLFTVTLTNEATRTLWMTVWLDFFLYIFLFFLCFTSYLVKSLP